MAAADVRKYLIQALIGCLVALGLVAIAAILIGGITGFVWRAMGAIFLAAGHIGVVLAILPTATPTVTDSPVQLKLTQVHMATINAMLGLITASLLTTVLWTWQIIPSEIGGKLTATYVVILFAIIYARIVYDVEIVNPKQHNYALGIYGLITALTTLLITSIFVPELFTDAPILGRLIAALFVALIILTLIIAIFQHLYSQAHPSPTAVKPSFSPFRTVAIIILAVLFMSFVMRLFFGAIGAHY